MTVVTTEFTPCKIDPELWFSEESEDILEAQDRCLDCPLFVQCREAGKGEPYGIWGGTTREERLLLFPLEMKRGAREDADDSARLDELALSLVPLDEREDDVDPEVAEVARLYYEGSGERKIATALGRSRSWVRARLQELREAGVEGVEERSKAEWLKLRQAS